MKRLTYKLLTLVFVSLQLVCCRDFTPSCYTLAFPEAPEAWLELLGEPCWRVEWVDAGGKRRIADILAGEKGFEIEIPVTWANPVLAWPYWEEFGLFAGVFRPAGGLFPLDVSGECLKLSWKAGVDGVFYWEIALANGENGSKLPANFDWERFRELFSDDSSLNEEVRRDPWLVDWRSVAEKTVSSGFDRRRLVPEKTEFLAVTVDPGSWYGTSPFAKALYFAEGESAAFPVRTGLNVWVSSGGILRSNGKTWVFTPKPGVR